MEKRAIPFSPPDITEAEMDEVIAALKSGWITTGPRTKELERMVAECCHTSKAVCLNSNTACAEMTMRILGNSLILRGTGKISDFSRVCGC